MTRSSALNRASSRRSRRCVVGCALCNDLTILGVEQHQPDATRGEGVSSSPCSKTHALSTKLPRSSHHLSCEHLVDEPVMSSHLPCSGHVRATTAGSLSLDNCHPFVHGKLMVCLTESSSELHSRRVVDAQWRYRRVRVLPDPAMGEALIRTTPRFTKVKRKIQLSLPDDIFDIVCGNTDSEWAFALFLSKARLFRSS
jgi:hypothetical protein